MAAGTDAEMVVRAREPEFVEEHIGHGRVVVLAGVDKDLVWRWRTTREKAAALMNCGRAPTTVRTRMWSPVLSGDR